ncbi:hypothetical protein PHJA_000124400 [Phtheirospermum japonicum]|uniref:Uncharacterized protein n=1 Tax=Phtheirospermum japonicum TaxID=374723 RepID=A0A830AYD0_9LAMI|nr:hypothetical protein PHJA_000124400 [Phtheirospermum japonicum]
MDAENMSKNTPEFLNRLLKSLDTNEADVGRSLTRFLRYHPINEFEPFFESIGLRPSDYALLLPRNLMFLNDDQLLLDNYYVLCNYGVPRNMIGKICKEAFEVFSYDHGVLQSKLRAFQDLGVKQSFAIKIVVSSPYLLKRDTNYDDLLKVLENLKNVGIGHDWVEERISKGRSYNWKHMLELIRLLNELGLKGEKLGDLIRHRPDILLDSSGRTTFRFVSFLLKFGSTKNDLRSVILEFPPIPVPKFSSNLHRCFKFMVGIKMLAPDIGPVFRSHPLLLGSCELKRINSLLTTLNCGVNMLCQMVKDDPFVLKKWVLRVRSDRVQEPNRALKVRTMKTKFLLSLGFVENSNEIERALKVFRGKGMELEERFDCLVNMGLSRDDVIAMLKVAPQILNQSKDVIRAKIGFFVNELGYPVSDLVTHPAIVSYTVQRVKLRLLTYKWLRDEGVVHNKLALSTLLACSEDIFVGTYVNAHPKGPEFWDRLKKEIYCK